MRIPDGLDPAATDAAIACDLDEATLVIRAGEGDAEAFEVLVRRHEGSLYRLARHLLRQAEDAEEAVQDAFLSAWRRLPEFRGETRFSSWMYRIVTNRCLNILRSRRPTVPLEAVGPAALGAELGSPERRAEGGQALDALRQALARLTPEQRACWVLRELHGLSYEEIAEAVRITPPAVRGRIFRARRQLAEAMRAWL